MQTKVFILWELNQANNGKVHQHAYYNGHKIKEIHLAGRKFFNPSPSTAAYTLVTSAGEVTVFGTTEIEIRPE